jgi:hypothetical protein
MKKIVLIACVSKKGDKKAKAKDLYISSLFINSLAYAYSLNPDKIYILSALHHLLDLDAEIEPYNVTLSKLPKEKRKHGIKILDSREKEEWGKKTVEMLSKQADLKNDLFIILAGEEYIKPIRTYLTNIDDKLKGKGYGERVRYLKRQLQ